MKQSYLMQLVNEIVDEYLEEYKKSGRKKRAKDDWTRAQAGPASTNDPDLRLRQGREKISGAERLHHPDHPESRELTRVDRDPPFVWPPPPSPPPTVRTPHPSRQDRPQRLDQRSAKRGNNPKPRPPRSADPLVHKADALRGRPTNPKRSSAPPPMDAQGYRDLTYASHQQASGPAVGWRAIQVKQGDPSFRLAPGAKPGESAGSGLPSTLPISHAPRSNLPAPSAGTGTGTSAGGSGAPSTGAGAGAGTGGTPANTGAAALPPVSPQDAALGIKPEYPEELKAIIRNGGIVEGPGRVYGPRNSSPFGGKHPEKREYLGSYTRGKSGAQGTFTPRVKRHRTGPARGTVTEISTETLKEHLQLYSPELRGVMREMIQELESRGYDLSTRKGILSAINTANMHR